MEVAILGYGKMGKIIASILEERGHQVILKANAEDVYADALLKQADVAIEFTEPESAIKNYTKCFELGVPVVSGTTGWLSALPKVKQLIIDNDAALFYAPNYSIGVNLFFKMNELIAKLMNAYPAYEVEMEENHHTTKKDSPSGTAIRTAEIVMEQLDAKDTWAENVITSKNQLLIAVKREENVPGTHKVSYLSDEDTIEITHTAFSRKGFALGAVLAAEWIVNLPVKEQSGYFGMNDMLQF